nr:histone deacetylase 14 [Tanacetum cinerariifolium]
MADENVLAPTSTRSNDHILPFPVWVPIRKSNFVLDLQNNLIFQISVDILQNINFFRAFIASALLDEDWFRLDANLLREALEITHVDQAHQFVTPHSGNAIMDFVNQLGYTEVIHFVSRMEVNKLYQPGREILSMINQCLTGKTFSLTKKGRKYKAHVIPYCRFTKLIICHLGRTYNIHQRSASPFHLAKEDLRLGNLKFVPKGEEDEAFGMPIPNELISNNIRNAPYYNAYLEMVAKHDRKVAVEKGGKKKPVTTKQLKSKPAKEKSRKPAPAPKPKTPATEEASTRPSVQPQDDAFANIVRESPSLADAKTGADADKTHSGGDTEILQFEEPLSLTETLSLMKNLDDAYIIGDQFLNDKSTKDDPGKLNVKAKVVSMVTVPIYQAFSSASVLSTPIIDLSPPKPVSLTTQAPIFTATTSTITTTLPLPPPLQQ